MTDNIISNLSVATNVTWFETILFSDTIEKPYLCSVNFERERRRKHNTKKIPIK